MVSRVTLQAYRAASAVIDVPALVSGKPSTWSDAMILPVYIALNVVTL